MPKWTRFLTSQTKHEPQSEAASIRDVVSQYRLHFRPVSLQILLGKLSLFILGLVGKYMVPSGDDWLALGWTASLSRTSRAHRVEFLEGALLYFFPVYRHEALVRQSLQGHEAKAGDERQALSHALGRHAAAVPDYARDAKLPEERLVLREEVFVVRVAGPVGIGAVRVGHDFADLSTAASLHPLLSSSHSIRFDFFSPCQPSLGVRGVDAAADCA